MNIPFERRDRQAYYSMLEEVFDSSFWSDGAVTGRFERDFGAYVGLGAKAVSSGGAALLCILEYLGVRGKEVIVPANTFWATAQAARKAGADVVFADCNRDDLCLSFADMVSKVTPRTKAVVVVHIGGHIAFEIEKIAAFCERNGIALVEDCAHAHGADWKGRAAGGWGFAGAYSFYATKTMPMGEGGMVVSRDAVFLEWLAKYRNYGKEAVQGRVTYPLKDGFNYRISEFSAALGLLQLGRLPSILAWKRELAAKYDLFFQNRVQLPDGMRSGYYKYIVFDADLTQETGRVFGPDDLGHRILGLDLELPNSEWVSTHHRCPPMFYGWEHAALGPEQLRALLLR